MEPLYRLNRKHILTPAILLAADSRRTLIQRLTQACGGLSPSPLSVSLFGSVARNDSTPHSDIDMLIIVNEDLDHDLDNWIDQLSDLALNVEGWTGNRLEAITHSFSHLAELVQADEPIVDSWRHDAVTLFGTDIHTLLNQIPSQPQGAGR